MEHGVGTAVVLCRLYTGSRISPEKPVVFRLIFFTLLIKVFVDRNNWTRKCSQMNL